MQASPHDSSAEMSTIGACMIDPRVIDDVLAVIGDADAFYTPELRTIFSAVLYVYETNQNLDMVLLRRHLEDRGVLEQVGGDSRLSELVQQVPVATNAVYYAKIVADKARLRRVAEACEDGTHKVKMGTNLPAEEVVAEVEQRIVDACETIQSHEAGLLGDLITKAIDTMPKQGHRGLRFDLMGDAIGNLLPGELTVIGARPSMGKTALGMQQAVYLGQQAPGVFFSVEMTEMALMQRVVAGAAGISVRQIRDGNAEHRRMVAATGSIMDSKVWVDDTSPLTMSLLGAKCRRFVSKHKVQWVVIDYLQYLRSPADARQSRYEEVSAVSRGLKNLAKNLDIHVVCLAQLNREVESRSDFRPRMSDFRSSGEIEQDADNIVLIHREAYYHQNDPNWATDNADRANEAELIVAKNRNDATGVVTCTWDGRTMRFRPQGIPYGEGIPL